MSIDNTAGSPRPGADGAHAATDTPPPSVTHHHPALTADAPHPADEKSGDGRDEYAGGTIILAAPYPTTPPMRMPDGTWAMLITGVDICDHGDRTGEVDLFSGCWEFYPIPANDDYEGDVVVRLTPPSRTDTPNGGRVDVDMALAYHERWRRVGLWPGLGSDWPRIVAPTAWAVMYLYADLLESRYPAPSRGVWA